MVRLVRDSGRVLNVGRIRERFGQSTKRGQAKGVATVIGKQSQDFLPARFCGRSQANLLLTWQSIVLLPSCA